jgi:hypothetical protein
MLLRARLDAEHGREAEARLGIRAAEAALEEDPGPREGKIREGIAALRERLEGSGGEGPE